MRKYLALTVTAGAMAAAALGLAGVGQAAPTEATQAEGTVKALEAQGYNVILNRTGTAPLSACTVASVQPGHTYSTVDSRGGSSPSETVAARTVLVDLVC